MKILKIIIPALIVAMSASEAQSVQLTVGINAWYCWWLPRFENAYRGEGNGITENDPENNSPAYNDRFEPPTPAFMAGPVVQLKFMDKWSLGAIFLISQKTETGSSFLVDSPGVTFRSEYQMTFRRYDGDFSISYLLGLGFSLYAGVKYLRWEGSGTFVVTSMPDVYSSHIDNETLGQALGPAVGVYYSLFITDAVFITATASGIYMKAWGDSRNEIEDTVDPSHIDKSKDYWYMLGFNATAGIGCYLDFLRSSLVIGGRVQYFRNEDLKNYDTTRDLFYGVFATVTYSF